MQPLRKDHVDRWSQFVKDEFGIAQDRAEEEISSQAESKVQEVGSKFSKELKLDKLIWKWEKDQKPFKTFKIKKRLWNLI